MVYLALGRTGLALAWTASAAAVVLAALRVGVIWGMPGVAAAISLTGVSLSIASQAIVNRLLGAGFMDFAKALWPALTCCAVMGVALVAVSRWLGAEGGLDLALLAVLGGMVYAVCVRRLGSEAYVTVRDAFRSRRLGVTTNPGPEHSRRDP